MIGRMRERLRALRAYSSRVLTEYNAKLSRANEQEQLGEPSVELMAALETAVNEAGLALSLEAIDKVHVAMRERGFEPNPQLLVVAAATVLHMAAERASLLAVDELDAEYRRRLN